MSVADALLLASLAPGQRRLRVALYPEPTWPMTALVSAGVASFFLAYIGVLVFFFLVGLPLHMIRLTHHIKMSEQRSTEQKGPTRSLR